MLWLAILFVFIFKFFLLHHQGKKVKCSTSQPKHRLFVGNIPRTWMERDLEKAVKKMGPGVISVELLKVRPSYESYYRVGHLLPT